MDDSRVFSFWDNLNHKFSGGVFLIKEVFWFSEGIDFDPQTLKPKRIPNYRWQIEMELLGTK
jgi:hypothetical protein